MNKIAQAISFLLLEFKELPTGDFLFHNEYFRTMFVISFIFQEISSKLQKDARIWHILNCWKILIYSDHQTNLNILVKVNICIKSERGKMNGFFKVCEKMHRLVVIRHIWTPSLPLYPNLHIFNLYQEGGIFLHWTNIQSAPLFIW